MVQHALFHPKRQTGRRSEPTKLKSKSCNVDRLTIVGQENGEINSRGIHLPDLKSSIECPFFILATGDNGDCIVVIVVLLSFDPNVVVLATMCEDTGCGNAIFSPWLQFCQSGYP